MGENPHILTGALVGGPGAPDDYYHDRRDDYVMNEVALDYNSGFQMALAGLLSATGAPSTAAPTAAPTAEPTAGPTAGPTDPNHQCPGGDLDGCIALCPEEDADISQACVHECID